MSRGQTAYEMFLAEALQVVKEGGLLNDLHLELANKIWGELTGVEKTRWIWGIRS